jgi:hypothetical protein
MRFDFDVSLNDRKEVEMNRLFRESGSKSFRSLDSRKRNPWISFPSDFDFPSFRLDFASLGFENAPARRRVDESPERC